MAVKRALLSLGLLVLVLIFAATGCGRSSGSAIDAGKILRSALGPMRALTSFHFTYAVTKPQGAKPPAGTEIVGITADISMEGLMKATVDVNQAGVPLQFQFVATQDTHFVQNPISGEWQSVPADLSPLGRLNLSSGAVQILEHVRDPRYMGQENVQNVQCHKVKGTVSASEISSIVAAADAQGDVVCELWIGVQDHLVRRIKITGAAQQGEDPRLVRTMELSRFGEPVKIEVPS